MEDGTIQREMHIDASPEVVFDVVSSPEHLRGWWTDAADYPAVPGGRGRIGFGENEEDRTWVQFTVVDAEPPRRFSFRWTHEESETAAPDNSLLVVFELEPAGSGTLLRMTESGFRERGWDQAKAIAEHADHVSGWGPLPGTVATVCGQGRIQQMSVMVDDDLWSAVGDPIRRRMLDQLLTDGSGTATSLSEHLPVTRQAVAKHLVVLDRVGLIRGATAGRERQFRVDEAQLARAVAQLAEVGRTWDGRLQRIKRIAETIQRGKDAEKNIKKSTKKQH